MKYIVLTLSVIMLFTACSKTSEVKTSREPALRAGSWKLSSGSTITVNLPNGKDTILDYMKFVPDCVKDDIIRFDSVKRGRRLAGPVTCNAGDPDYWPFVWQFTENENYIDLYNGFNNVYAIVQTIEPYHFDTISHGPLELDTIVGRLDTLPGFIKEFIVLDTIRELRFNSIPVAASPLANTVSGFDIHRAYISSFSPSSFTINFPLQATYPDSTNYHAGAPNNEPPIIKADTFHYKLIFTSM